MPQAQEPVKKSCEAVFAKWQNYPILMTFKGTKVAGYKTTEDAVADCERWADEIEHPEHYLDAEKKTYDLIHRGVEHVQDKSPKMLIRIRWMITQYQQGAKIVDINDVPVELLITQEAK